jgi:hypothetical protein
MSIELEKGLYSLIAGASPQTSAAGRVHPRLPQNVTMPAVRYQRITASRVHALDTTVGVTSATVQVDCFADTYDEAKTLADEVRTILHGYRGAWGTLVARHVSLETESDLYEQDGDRVTHWVSQRYMIYTNMD